jgi:sporulation protein YlmC with PRC-barrel domain
MKIFNNLLGKEVIDESGDSLGVVEAVRWDHENNTIDSIIIKEKDVSPGIGLRKRIVPYDVIEAVGEKINIFLLKIA